MKACKNIVIGIFGFLVIQHVTLWVTGNLHFYKTLADTIFKGRMGPSILDHQNYPYNIINTSDYQPHKLAASCNKKSISKTQLELLKSTKTTAFLVLKNNELVHEEYWDSFSDSTLSNSWSMAKSYVSLLIGAAITDGYIQSIDDKVGDFLPQYRGGLNDSLTIRHLLEMCSGIDFGEEYKNPFGFMAKALYGDDVVSITLKHQVSCQPGTMWKYQGGNTILLNMIIEKATKKSPSKYFSERIWQRIGAKNNALWSLDHENGLEKSYCCVFSNASDFARVGLLVANYGKWNNQQLIDSSYIANCLNPVNLPDKGGVITDHYSNAWWLLNYNNKRVVYARGINGQYTFIFPDENIVVVRLGHSRIKEKGAKHPKDVYFYLDTAFDLLK